MFFVVIVSKRSLLLMIQLFRTVFWCDFPSSLLTSAKCNCIQNWLQSWMEGIYSCMWFHCYIMSYSLNYITTHVKNMFSRNSVVFFLKVLPLMNLWPPKTYQSTFNNGTKSIHDNNWHVQETLVVSADQNFLVLKKSLWVWNQKMGFNNFGVQTP